MAARADFCCQYCRGDAIMIVQARTFTNSILRHHHHAWRALPGENQSRQLDFQTQSSKN